jgi:DNA-binding MarR family transcriptional regulator
MAGKKTASAPQAAESAFRTLIKTLGLVRRVMEPYFSRFGISGSQWGVLRVLHRGEEQGTHGLRLTDLGDRLLIRAPSVTGAVDRLQRMGLVQRKTSSRDLRAKHVSLTLAGHRLIKRVEEHRPEQIATVLGGLSGEEQMALRQLLDRLGAHLERMAEREGHAPPVAERTNNL